MPRVPVNTVIGREARDFYDTYPAVGNAGAGLIEAIYSGANPLPPVVREAARARMAELNACVVCQAARPVPGLSEEFYENVSNWRTRPDLYAPEHQLAIEFAELFSEDHLAIDDEMMERLRTHFSNEEIAALALSCAYFIGFGRLTRVLMLDHVCALEAAA